LTLDYLDHLHVSFRLFRVNLTLTPEDGANLTRRRRSARLRLSGFPAIINPLIHGVYTMKWTLKKVGSKYVVKFQGEDPLEFISKGGALAYINDRVFTSFGL